MSDFQSILQHFTKYSTAQLDDISDGRQKIVLPSIPIQKISQILAESQNLFKNEPVMLTLSSPMTIVGDLHGHLLDLLRILSSNGLPSDANPYLFLGDIVDRGEFSLETVLVVLLLKIIYPSNVFVIRGNHEFQQMCQQFGFFAEVNECYPGTDVFFDFMNTFSYIPVAALINEKYICVHGGIGPNVFSLLQFANIQRPITDFNADPIVTSLLWSDPSETATLSCSLNASKNSGNKTDKLSDFVPSKRGGGYIFGKIALEAFLKDTKTKVLIRAHECVSYGIEKLFGGKLITVFSASNYCGNTANNGAILRIVKNGVLETVLFQPFNYVKRKAALFMPIYNSNKKSNLQTARSLFDMKTGSKKAKTSLASTLKMGSRKNSAYKLNNNLCLMNKYSTITENIGSLKNDEESPTAAAPPSVLPPIPRPKMICKSESHSMDRFQRTIVHRQSLPLQSILET